MSRPEEDDDARLRAAMQALRTHDASRAPDFAELRARPRKRRLASIAPAIGAFAVAAGVFALWCSDATMSSAPVAGRSASAPRIAASAAASAPASAPPVEAVAVAPSVARDDLAPLDFLLDAPSRAFVASSPSLDFLLTEPSR